ncbi:putative cell survival pathways protein [Entophlyctis luteolus]|nr:putative cell survival pathways protein [Entophlyctis luteolus]
MLSWTKKLPASSAAPSAAYTPAQLPDPEAGSYASADSIPAIIAPVDESELQWALLDSGATETMTFQVILPGRIFVLLQMAYSTIGPFPTIAITCRAYHPDGTKAGKTINHGASAFKLFDNKMSATCGEMQITYNAHTRGYTIAFTISGDVEVSACFIPSVMPCKIGDGKAGFGSTGRDGSVSAQFIPKMLVDGTVKMRGQTVQFSDGQGLFHHVVQVKPQNVAGWNWANFQSQNGDALMLYEFEMPKKSTTGVKIVSQGCIVINGQTIAVTTMNRGVHVQKQLDIVSGYKVPSQMYFIWNGNTVESGEPVKVEISTMLEHKLDTIDVLSELPYLIRKFIQTFVTAPFLYSWFEAVTAKISVGGKEWNIDGNVFIECSFLYKE